MFDKSSFRHQSHVDLHWSMLRASAHAQDNRRGSVNGVRCIFLMMSSVLTV